MTRAKWKKLTNPQKAAEVALLRGWVCKDGADVKGLAGKFCATGCKYWSPDGNTNWQIDPPPITLDEIHKAELKQLSDYGMRAVYINEVYGIICRDVNGRAFKEDGLTPTDVLIFAEAIQKAEAFCIVLDRKRKNLKIVA